MGEYVTLTLGCAPSIVEPWADFFFPLKMHESCRIHERAAYHFIIKGTAYSKTCITIKSKRYGLILIRLQSFFTTFAATLISIFILELQFSLSHFNIFVWSFPRPICLDLLTENGRVNCRVIVDSHMPWACKAFSQLHGQLLARNPSLLRCWRFFMIKLWNHNLIDACTMNSCNVIIDEVKNKKSSDPKWSRCVENISVMNNDKQVKLFSFPSYNICDAIDIQLHIMILIFSVPWVLHDLFFSEGSFTWSVGYSVIRTTHSLVYLIVPHVLFRLCSNLAQHAIPVTRVTIKPHPKPSES